jgi:ribosomal protein L37AE/L43A
MSGKNESRACPTCGAPDSRIEKVGVGEYRCKDCGCVLGG